MKTLAEYETPLTDAVYPPEIIAREVVKQRRKWGWGTLHDMRERSCDLERKLALCRDALDGITARYCDLVNSGDAGFWNPETDADVIFARAALEATK